MQLDYINKKIELIVELARPDKKGEINKLLKEIRDNHINYKISNIKNLFDFYTQNSTKKEINFDILRKFNNLKENDSLLSKINTILNLFHEDMQEEILNLLEDLINETDKQTVFEFNKGLNSLIAHIQKSVD